MNLTSSNLYCSSASKAGVCESQMIVSNDSNGVYLENGNRFTSVMVEALLQLIIWHYVVGYTRSYIVKHCSRSKWFIQWAKKPDGMGGETGSDRLLSQMGHFAQAWFSGIFLSLAYYFSDSPYAAQFFTTGALAEFAVEVLDVKDMIIERYIAKAGVYSEKRTPLIGVVLVLFHHSGAFLSILPACIYYADNTHVHQIGMGLLGFASFFMVNSVIYFSRDVYDLRERGQFAVVGVLNVIVMTYFRWIVACPGMYWFMYEEYGAMPMMIRIVMIAYLVLFKIFDLFMVFWSVVQTYGYLIGGKMTKKPTKITVCSLRRPPSTPLDLLRMKSAPLF